MEGRFRPQVLIALAGLLVACGEDHAPTPVPRIDARAAPDVLEALLNRSQGDRRGTFGRVVLEVREAPDALATTVIADLPRRLRVTNPEGVTFVLDDDRAFRWHGSESSSEPTADERATMEQLRDALALVCLQPLEHATAAERLGPDRLAFVAHDRRYELDYDAATDAPRALRGVSGDVTFVASYDSGTKRVPTEVELRGIGRRWLRFQDTGVAFDADTFRPPDPARGAAPVMQIGGPATISTPRVESTTAVSWLMLPDPGAWDQRIAAYRAAAKRLRPAGYTNGGDPILVEEGDRRWFVVPFRPATSDPQPVVPADGEEVRRMPTESVLVVEPSPAAFADRVHDACAALDQKATADRHRWTGPVRIAVNLIGRDPGRDPKLLDDAPLRVSRPIAN